MEAINNTPPTTPQKYKLTSPIVAQSPMMPMMSVTTTVGVGGTNDHHHDPHHEDLCQIHPILFYTASAIQYSTDHTFNVKYDVVFHS
mmetsp:Transcript_3035/g.3611  ORF Transcript_3035/g.3611 Transcript_3035/m.3611 type:complete len:87 (+) Transcript_3035:73-333(+)